ncbi:MAG: ArsA family ATPase [Spirochaetaceae bacterium]|nr:ArsA family ATPase [Myxococcales bacterium]MCB9723768.1 ArsA family ATPase [Spirochaetaceae bacterium]HPG25547.1 TRC40/GET3/ArsA family transport-energizing ATPase [Myxococcota bacterium]
MRVLLHTGKGGVGKTTLALASALAAARHGHRVCVLSTDPAHSLADALASPVGPNARRVTPGVWAREIRAQVELDRGWQSVQAWLRELLREEADALVAEELLAFPGIEELVALRAVREVEQTGDFDLCIVDCAPTGSTLRMLRFPDALRIFMEHFFDLERRGARLLRPLMRGFEAGRLIPREDFFDAFERLYEEIDDVRRILLDEARTSARLVVNPTRVIVDETRRSFAYLSLYGVATDAVLVNRVMPEAVGGGYFERWLALEREELAAIEASFPVPIRRVPLQPREVIGVDALEALGRDLFGDIDPAARLAEGRPIRIRRGGGRTRLEIDLPGISKEEIDVLARGHDLHLRVRDGRRTISLPDSLAGRPIERVRLQEPVLEIVFGERGEA